MRLALLAVPVAALIGFGAARATNHQAAPTVRIATALPSGGFADVVERDVPAVVSISTSRVLHTSARGAVPPEFEPFFRQFGGPSRPHRQSGEGSGVVVSQDGYVLTNNHVVDKSTQMTVKFADGREFPARLVGSDNRTDIAVLKIDATGLKSVAFADSSKVRVGDYAIAIGNPFGIGQTVTFGIVSATGRANLGIEDYEDFIQTDAAINPGNSGGALVNSNGDLIGINTAILSPAGGNNGVGFAIPANLARHIMDQLVSNGKVTRAYLGVMLQPLTPQLAKALDIPLNRGALVADVSPDGPAAKAGLQKGDVVVELNGQAVRDSSQLKLLVGSAQPGSAARLKVLRNGSERTITVTLAELSETRTAHNENRGEESAALDGAELSNLTPSLRRDLDLPRQTQGVVVTDLDPQSGAAEAGLREGDVIQKINRRQVGDVASLQKELAQATGKTVLLEVSRGGSSLFLAVPAHS